MENYFIDAIKYNIQHLFNRFTQKYLIISVKNLYAIYKERYNFDRILFCFL